MADEKFITENSDGSVTVKLSRPITVSGVSVNALQLREPTVADQLATQRMTGSDADKDVSMLANLCMVAPAEIQQLKLRDYRRVQAAFASFFD